MFSKSFKQLSQKLWRRASQPSVQPCIDRLQMTAKALPFLDEDTRIVPILNNLSQGFLAGVSSEWSTAAAGNGDEITADMIDDMARKHYPACMRNLHDCLRRDKHLKHFGRLQYGLFLKVSNSPSHTRLIRSSWHVS